MALHEAESAEMDGDTDYWLRGLGHAQERGLGIRKSKAAALAHPGY